MYKVLNIGGEDYKLEYTMEAALFGECTETATQIIEQIAEASAEVDENLPDDEKEKQLRNKLKDYIKTVSNLPQKVLTLFYAGLIEHHGTHPLGDGTVKNLQDAKEILFKFFKENKGKDEGDFMGMMKLIIDQMGEDGFFDLVGLNKAFQVPEKPVKQPQDHKKKATKVSEN